MIPPVSDIHTHDSSARDAVINLERGGEPARQDAVYSAGWHPWWGLPADMEWVSRMARRPEVVMIGECGVDIRRGHGSRAEQLKLTELHARLAEETGKPLILHIVGAWGEIIGLRKRLRPEQPWIIHGFRGNAVLARQLVDAGFYISFGEKFNAEAFAAVPPCFRLRETD